MWVSDTYVIIYFVVLLAAISAYLIPIGQFETGDVTYNGQETRTVLIPDSFEYVTSDGGAPETENVGHFASVSDVGILNYVLAGLVSGDEFSVAVGVVAFIILIGGAFGIVIVMRTRAVETGMRKPVTMQPSVTPLRVAATTGCGLRCLPAGRWAGRLRELPPHQGDRPGGTAGTSAASRESRRTCTGSTGTARPGLRPRARGWLDPGRTLQPHRETDRRDVRRRARSGLQLERLSERYDKLVREAVEQFMIRANYEGVAGYDLNDLYPWESRLGMWGGSLQNEMDAAMLSMTGFCNRLLFARAFGLDLDERLAQNVLLGVTRRSDQESWRNSRSIR